MTDPALPTQMANFERVVLRSDTELALTVLHSDYALVLVLPVLAVMPRDRWLEVLPDYRVAAYEVQERHLDVVGDCATLLQRLTMSATVLGEDRSGTFVISDVWLRGPDGWRIWRRHSTPLAAGPMPGVG
ncbi:MAG: SnoaL-like domain [Nocardioidaceae bacterium]|nr:SnoaL-like domain [Nocardioidaceae bacterium]